MIPSSSGLSEWLVGERGWAEGAGSAPGSRIWAPQPDWWILPFLTCCSWLFIVVFSILKLSYSGLYQIGHLALVLILIFWYSLKHKKREREREGCFFGFFPPLLFCWKYSNRTACQSFSFSSPLLWEPGQVWDLKSSCFPSTFLFCELNGEFAGAILQQSLLVYLRNLFARQDWKSGNNLCTNRPFWRDP